ncbi:hypothetical protein WICPIJ_003660 [Wickerhamomyces pijperi]|uniref:Cytochrome b-c1 complex subunit 6, mitochondrial n=1 Tax=Wickerhamomyces pijperi TaxID=599730 RepID=A0A9P8Q9F6_WICPI|nr:hypothetical protein WICPIJ_003660 [Wickerhamomyces pijperi]
MFKFVQEALEEVAEAFVPTVARAESEEEEAEEEEDDEDEEDEDEEEEGSADPLDKLREECSNKAELKPYVHHYAECVERVTKEMEEEGYENKDYKEDCVEEFFHLQHHLNDCVAPRLFYKLK